MTPEGLVASTVWAAVAGYAVWRADFHVAKAMALKSLIAQASADEATRTALRKQATGTVVLPDDLEAVALQETEEWARDNERLLMRERYLELRPLAKSDREAWQQIRRAVGIAEMP